MNISSPFTRKIIHLDMDAFFASVEQRDEPQLKNKPVIVGGYPKSRGVVCAASYEARKYGVHSAMASSRALKLCPEAIFIKPNLDKYRQVSLELKRIFSDYTDLIEPLSLDEAYLDVTVNKINNPLATVIAKEIKKRILQELHLTASCGIAPNKLLAKIASDINKPNGFYVIKPHQVQQFIQNLELKKIPGVGRVTEKKLRNLGLVYCRDIFKLTQAELIKESGQFGEKLYQYAQGIDLRPVISFKERHSVGSEETFAEDLLNIHLIQQSINHQITKISNILASLDLKGRTITLKIKYHDFSRVTRSKTFPEAITNRTSMQTFCYNLLKQTLAGEKKVRLVGVTVSNFSTLTPNSKQLQFDFAKVI